MSATKSSAERAEDFDEAEKAPSEAWDWLGYLLGDLPADTAAEITGEREEVRDAIDLATMRETLRDDESEGGDA